MQSFQLENRDDLYLAANRFQITLRHFACGTWISLNPEETSLPFNRLFFVMENHGGGENYVREGQNIHIFEAKTLYFIPAGYPVQMRLHNDLKFLSVQCSVELFRGIDFFSGCKNIVIRKSGKSLSELCRIFCTNPENEQSDSALKLKQLVLEELCSLRKEYPDTCFQDQFRFKKYTFLLHWLEEYISAETQVADLAELEHLTREAFSRKFHGETGLSPKKLIKDMLVRKTIDFLERGFSVKETAGAAGFSNEFVFSRFFKRETGYSPSEWRKREGF